MPEHRSTRFGRPVDVVWFRRELVIRQRRNTGHIPLEVAVESGKVVLLILWEGLRKVHEGDQDVRIRKLPFGGPHNPL